MEQERCYVCRRWIPEGQVYRRVMPTAQYTGGNLGTASGVFAFTRAEVVSLCAACDAAEVQRAVWRPGWGLKALAVWCIAAVWVSAVLRGHWVIGVMVTGLVLWRIRLHWQRRSRSAMMAPPAAQSSRTPPLLPAPRRLYQPSDWCGDEDA